MEHEYKDLKSQSIESGIIFYGLESCKPNYTYKGNNVRKNYVIHYIEEGKGTFSSAGRPFVQLQAGDCFILPQGVPCFYQADSKDPWKYSWIGLSGIKVGNILSGSSLLERRYLHQIQNTAFKNSLTSLYEALHFPNNLKNNLLVESLIYRMFYDLVDEFPAKDVEKTSSKTQFELAVSYMKNNYNTGCNMIDVCHSLSISRSYLYGLFQKFTDSSPQQILTSLRMEDAKQQLKTTDKSIQQISYSVGYGDSFTFSKAFKRYCGYSPSDYRKMI